jgi:hypothetical protein
MVWYSVRKKREREDVMENIYFFWWMKYNINSGDTLTPDYIKQIIEDFKDTIPDFNNMENTSKKASDLFDLIIQNLEHYRSSDNDLYLEEIRKITGQITPLLNDLYEGIEIFRKATPLKEEEFLFYEAEKLVNNSSLYTGLESLVSSGSVDNIDKDELYTYLDEVRDILYDLQDGELEDLFGSSDSTLSREKFTDLFQSVLDNLEESLEIFERGFAGKNYEDSLRGLEKLRTGLLNLKLLELIARKEGVK